MAGTFCLDPERPASARNCCATGAERTALEEISLPAEQSGVFSYRGQAASKFFLRSLVVRGEEVGKLRRQRQGAAIHHGIVQTQEVV